MQLFLLSVISLMCCRDGQITVVELLIPKGIDINARLFGASPLSVAVQANKLAVVQLLLHFNADVNQPDADGRTPLWWSGPSVLVSPLQSEARWSHLDIAKLLLKCNAKVDAVDKEGVSPLLIAGMSRNGNI